jgi:hypothetical protein
MSSGQYEHTMRHGAVSGPLNATIGAVFAALLVWANFLPWWVPVAMSVLGAASTIVVGRRTGGEPAATAYVVGCWLGAGGWVAWIAFFGWSVVAVIVLALGAMSAALLAPAFLTEADRPVEERVDPGFESDWARLINQVLQLRSGASVSVKKVEDWLNGAGYTLDVVFPAGTLATFKALQDRAADLAAAKQLPKGCPIRVVEGEHQGSALMHVSTVNDLARELPHPTDYSPRSILDEICIGYFRDRTDTLIELYQASGIIAGRRGAGKTVLLQTITAFGVRCRDTVVIHVDLNGAGMSAPWMLPFAEGAIGTSPLGWVANGPEEAMIVARVMTAIAKDRKARFQAEMTRQNVDILPVSPSRPAYLIIVDEGGEVFGQDAKGPAADAAKALRELQRIGRAMCVNVLLSVQRGTATYVPSDVKKNASLRIVGQVEDDGEVASLLDWNKGVRAADLTQQGSYFLRRDGSVPAMFKGFRLMPAQIVEIAKATASIRPDFDEYAKQVGGRLLAERWDRLDPWLRKLRGEYVPEPDDEPAPPAAGSSTRPVPTSPDGLKTRVEETKARMRDMSARAVARKVLVEMPADRVNATLKALAELPAVDPRQATAPEPAVDPATRTPADRLAFVVQIVEKAGAEGARTGEIVEKVIAAGYTQRRQTVQETIDAAQKEGLIVSKGWGMWIAPSYAA